MARFLCYLDPLSLINYKNVLGVVLGPLSDKAFWIRAWQTGQSLKNMTCSDTDSLEFLYFKELHVYMPLA